MGYFQVMYDSRFVNYDCIGFIRLATGVCVVWSQRKERKMNKWPQHSLFSVLCLFPAADEARQPNRKIKTGFIKVVGRKMLCVCNI